MGRGRKIYRSQKAIPFDETLCEVVEEEILPLPHCSIKINLRLGPWNNPEHHQTH